MSMAGVAPLVLIGDSHCNAYARAVADMQVPILVAPLGSAKRFTAENLPLGDGVPMLGGSLGRRFGRFAARHGLAGLQDCRGRLVLSLGLAGGRFYGSFEGRRAGFGTQVDPARQHVSEAVLDAIVEDLQRPALALVERLAREGYLRCSVAGPPPQARHPMVQEIGEAAVLALDARYRRPMHQLLARYGIPVAAAEDVADEKGLLRPEFWGNDHAHGNLAYGRRTVEAVLATAGKT